MTTSTFKLPNILPPQTFWELILLMVFFLGSLNKVFWFFFFAFSLQTFKYFTCFYLFLLGLKSQQWDLFSNQICLFPPRQYEVKPNWIFVPSATASSSDHNKGTEDKPPEQNLQLLKTRGRKRITSRILNTRNQILKRPKNNTYLPNRNKKGEAIARPSIFWEDNWSETRSLCLLNSFVKAHVPTLLLALLILTTLPTHHQGVKWAAIC